MRYWIGLLFLASIISVGWIITDELNPYPFQKTQGFLPMPVSAENPTTVEGAELGRYLFYDPILSRDSTVSCASCHKQEYAFSDGGNAFSTGINGVKTPRNAPPLFNLAWYPSLFWDGRASSIEVQVLFPVIDHGEMDMTWAEVVDRLNNYPFYQEQFKAVFKEESIDSIQIVKAIAQFERTLISNDSKFDRAIRGETKLSAKELDGMEIVNNRNMGDCMNCHPTDAHLMGTTFKFSNNGLDEPESWKDYQDKGKGAVFGDSTQYGWFKIPSIRNVAVTGPYMHDGRFETLEEVVEHYSTGVKKSPNIDPLMTKADKGGMQLSNKDKESIIAFLQALTDSTFITNPAFSNPWED